MTDRELKKSLKKLGIILILMFVIIIILSVYTLGSTKATLSIYDNSGYENSVQTFGINEDEFKQYLSMVGNLISDGANENLKTMNMATYFVDNMCASYEVEKNENGLKYYDADVINKVAEEVQGVYIKESLDAGSSYTYNKEQNIYVQNSESGKIPYCINIENISKNGEKIEVTYKLAMMTSDQMAKYLTGQDVDFGTYTVKAVVMINENYEYSKYFVSSIEKI